LSEVFIDFQLNQTTYAIENRLVESLQNLLYAKWHKILLSNVRSVELYDLAINLTFVNSTSTGSNSVISAVDVNSTTLIVTYLLKLDPRISQVSQIIYKLLRLVNVTLSNPNVYENIQLQNVSAILLADNQIAGKLWTKLMGKPRCFAK
jgi:hypothetical protein